jgi:hypothetical protein
MPRIVIMGLTILPTPPIVLNVSQPYRPLTGIVFAFTYINIVTKVRDKVRYYCTCANPLPGHMAEHPDGHGALAL